MSFELGIISIFNLVAVLLVGMASVYGAKAIKRLYPDEFSSIINWMLIIVEAVFVIQLIIFLIYFFDMPELTATVFVLLTTIFIALLFFITTYKIVKFTSVFSFEEEITKDQVKELVRKKIEAKKKK